MLFVLLTVTLKNLNTVLYNYIQDNAIINSIIFIFVIMLSCMDLNASSMSESLAISLALEWKILRSFFSYSLRLILSEL